jgi:PBSX family phage terminase large subunit
MVKVKTITPQPHQMKVLNSIKRYILMVAGVQTGKTFIGAVWLYIQISLRPNDGVFLVGAPSYKILEQSTMHKFFELFPVKTLGTFDKQRMVLHGKTGFTVYFRSLDDPDAIEGISANAVWLDEAGKMKRKAWVNALGRVSATNGRILLTTTPYALNFVYTDLFKPWKEKKTGYEDIDVFQFSSIDNKYFQKQSYIDGQRMLSPAEFARRYNGSFTKLEGQVYADLFDMTGDVKPGVIVDELPEFEYVIGGIDWGWNDPAVVIPVGVTADGDIYLCTEFYKSKTPLEQIREISGSFMTRYKVGYYYAGKDQPGNIKYLQTHGVACNKSNNDIDWGTGVVRGLIMLDKFHIHSSCTNTLDEFKTYQYSGDENNQSEKPLDENNHAMDCIRYAVASHPAIPMILQQRQYLDKVEEKDPETVRFWQMVEQDIQSSRTEIMNQGYNTEDYYSSISDDVI